MTAPAVVDNVTCLGCGCACDDIVVTVRDSQIVEARNACTLGARWFGNGQAPTRCVVDGSDVEFPEAVLAAAKTLMGATRPLVYLAPDISCEAQREAAAVADLLRSRLDSVTSATSAFVLVGQERGYATSTLGEVRNRADVVILWAVDLEGRYPRFASRYAPDPIGTHVPRGRQSRTVIAVDVGAARATADADRRIELAAANELATLTAMHATANATGGSLPGSLGGRAWEVASELAPVLRAARYVALVYDAESDAREYRSPQRFDALASLSQALNGHTRCAAIALRGGGNRSGADAVLVAQTGYPFAIDFSHGFPRYDPHDGTALALLRRGEVDVALIVGDPTLVPRDIGASLERVECVVIGPGASTVSLGRMVVRIDTGRDGIHADGTAFRSDDVPLPLRASLSHPRATADVVRLIAGTVRQMQFADAVVVDTVSDRATPRV